MNHTAFRFEAAGIRAHIFDRFVVLIEAAAWLVSFATDTRQGAFRKPSGAEAPLPRKILFSVWNTSSSANALWSSPPSAAASSRISSVITPKAPTLRSFISMRASLVLLAVGAVPSSTQYPSTPP